MSPRQPTDRALATFLARPALRRLWAAARQKIEHYGALRGSVRIDHPTAAERRAAADLLGLKTVPPAGRPLRLTLTRLDRTLRESRFAIGLEEALTRQSGPLRDRPAEKASDQAAWRGFWQRAAGHPLLREVPELVSWLDDLERTGLYRRLASRPAETRETLWSRVVTVLADLLREDRERDVRLAVLANRTLGDSHALDVGHRVPALVLRALARLHRRPLPRTAAERRDLWSLAGVVCDDLSCAVLVAGLTPGGDDLLHRYLREHAAAGEPLRITLRQLTAAAPVVLPEARRIFACENPAVVSVAADRLRSACPPLVCLAGQPDTAARVLLRALTGAGSELLYHGDFDWGGLRIAGALARDTPFSPWRYTTADYLAAAQTVEPLPLSGLPVDADWDEALRPAMEERGVAIEEEAVIDDLLADLAA